MNCIVIDVPKSKSKPHAFNTGVKDEFYIRNGNISTPMRYNDIKNSFYASFNAQEFTQKKIKRVIKKMLSFIRRGKLYKSLLTDSSLIVHIIPERPLDESNFLDLRDVKDSEFFVNIISIDDNYMTPEYICNEDSYIILENKINNNKIRAYIRVFENARIEAAEIESLNQNIKNKTICHWKKFESEVVESIYRYIKGLESLGIPGGYFFAISLLNMKGKKILYADREPFLIKPLANDVITKTGKWTKEKSFEEAIYPVLTSLSRLFGLEKSVFYDDENNPIPEKFEFMNKYRDLKKTNVP